jgi:hypothetical protein
METTIADRIRDQQADARAEIEAPDLASELVHGPVYRTAHGFVVVLLPRDQIRPGAQFPWHVRRSGDAVLVASGWARDPDAAWSAAEQAAWSESQAVVNCET